MRLRIFLLLPMILLACGVVEAAKERVSILDFKPFDAKVDRLVTEAERQDLTQQVRDVAASQLDGGRFEIMTLESILVMLPPGRKDLGECEGQCEVETARNLGSRWHVVGDVKKVGTKLVLSVRLYDVASGTMLGGVRVEGANVDALAGNVTTKAKELLSRIPGTGRSNAVESAAGGVDDIVAVPPAPGAPKRIAKFTSDPSGAAVAVDGNPVGTTPCSKTLMEGDHAVAMALDGYRSQKKAVKVATNGQEISFKLEAIQTRLSLEALDDRTGDALVADVYVDGSKVGQTPYDGLVAVVSKKIEVMPKNMEKKAVEVALSEGKIATSVVHFRSRIDPVAGGALLGPRIQEDESGSFVDPRDGHSYRWVTIGGRRWMAENLNYSGKGLAKMGKCYNQSPENCAKYGRLYSWYEATSSCPDGWHLPSKSEWSELFDYVERKNTNNAVKLLAKNGWPAGCKLCASDRYVDMYGFGVLPGGRCIGGAVQCYDLGKSASFWSSTALQSSWLSRIRDKDADSKAAVTTFFITTRSRGADWVDEPTGGSYFDNDIWAQLSARCVGNSADDLKLHHSITSDGIRRPVGVDTFVDARDGYTYRSVKIGTQTWMAENLAYSGVQKNVGACLDDKAINCYKYGRIYTWDEVMAGSASSAANPSGVNGLCPAGWHVPSDTEWVILVSGVGDSSRVKLSSTTEWDSCTWSGCEYKPGNGTDLYGFNALPIGGRFYFTTAFFFHSRPFSGIGGDTRFWSSSETSGSDALSWEFSNSRLEPWRIGKEKQAGRMLRCLKN